MNSSDNIKKSFDNMNDDPVLPGYPDLGEKKRDILNYEESIIKRYLETANDVIILINKSYEVIFINKKGSEILGYEEKEIIGTNWFENYVPERIREKVFADFKKIMAGSTDFNNHSESPILTKAGEERLFRWYSSVVKNPAGEVISAFSIGRDITDKEIIDDKLK